MTKGIVSANRTLDGQPFIQSDTAITHGNSGGPLLDEKGQVVGIAVSVIEPNGSQIGLNFFIPIDDALRVLGVKPIPSVDLREAAAEDPPAKPRTQGAGQKHAAPRR
jgi:S1-C subfamily serine protease